MDSNQIALNVGSGQGLQRRMPPPGLARSPGLAQSVDGFDRLQNAPAGLAEGDQLSKGLVGRVATVEWQQKVELSQSIGVADQAMGEIDDQLQEAKRGLIEIVKMFPPYPHGSEERAEFLNSYHSLRLQVDNLIFPPEYDMAAQILGGRDQDESLPSEFRGFQVDSGSSGLNLMVPKVPVDDLKDEEIPAVIADLERASGVLKERRMSLQLTASTTFSREGGEESSYVSLSLESREQLATIDATLGRPETGIHSDLPNIYWGE